MSPRPLSVAIENAVVLRVRIIAYVVRRLGPALGLVAAYTVLAGFVLRWDLARHGVALPDWGATLYAMYTQLFQPMESFPGSPLARLIFWITPVVGTILIAEGVVKVGGEFLDPERRYTLWVRIMTGAMKNHVVVCGIGHVGYRVIEELRALGEEVAGIEREESDFVSTLRRENVPVHRGDARRDDLLALTGIAHAKAVVCATNDDLANLEIALDAKRVNPKIRVIMRMFDQRLAGKVGGALELDQSFSTSALSAPVIALSARIQGVKGAYRLDDRTRVLCELPMPARWVGRTVSQVEDERDLRVIRLKRAGKYQSAKSGAKLEAEDRVVVDADADALQELA